MSGRSPGEASQAWPRAGQGERSPDATQARRMEAGRDSGPGPGEAGESWLLRLASATRVKYDRKMGLPRVQSGCSRCSRATWGRRSCE